MCFNFISDLGTVENYEEKIIAWQDEQVKSDEDRY